MEGIQVKIDPEQINQYIADAILKSAIGTEINRAIAERLSDFRLRESITKAVDSTINQLICNLLATEHSVMLTEVVKEKLTEAIVGDLTSKAIERWLRDRGSV